MFINEKKAGGDGDGDSGGSNGNSSDGGSDGEALDPTGNLSITKTVTGEGDREKA